MDKGSDTVRGIGCGTISGYVKTEGCVIETTRQARAQGGIVLDLSEGESDDQGVCPATPFTTLSFVRAGCVPPEPEELS